MYNNNYLTIVFLKPQFFHCFKSNKSKIYFASFKISISNKKNLGKHRFRNRNQQRLSIVPTTAWLLFQEFGKKELTDKGRAINV